MPSTADVDAAIAAAMELKEQIVRREGVGTDVAHMLDLRRDSTPLVTLCLKGDRNLWLLQLEAGPALTDADTALFIVEGYGSTSKRLWDWATSPDYQYGELRRLFAEGNPEVHEALMVNVRRRDGFYAFVERPYRYDGRRIEWLDAVDLDSESGGQDDGEIQRALARGFEGQARRPGPAMSGVELARFLKLEAVAYVPRRPPRNEPCPCGSGLKAKRCCWSGQ
jgi:hypothetical protein